ncbi:MAG: rod shape-determining protein MreC [Bacteroidetes bacterium]|nr:MAG: rod shape-determining protein MreC [Bacteroidota bacterium]
MRSLFLFIIKFHAFFLFISLEIIAGYCIFQYNYYHRSSFLNSTNSIASGLYSAKDSFKEYLKLGKVNDQLLQENAILRTLVKKSFYYNHVEGITIEDSTREQLYRYIAAKVINNSTNKRNNYLTLNRGSIHGIEKNMGVISSNGIVGIVKDVSEHFSTVLSLLHKDAKISSKLDKDNYPGETTWDGSLPTQAELSKIPNHIKLNKGDHVVTTGFSSIFPEGISIGTVDAFHLIQGESSYSITLNLSTNFRTLDYVYLIKNVFSKEQLELESISQDD